MSVSILFSAILALSLTPALCATLLSASTRGHHGRSGFFGWFNRGVERMTAGYQRRVVRILQRGGRGMAVFVALVVALGLGLHLVPGAFLPEEDQGYFMTSIQLPADATAERYLPDPFGTGPGARLYRSGDLARALADGRLDYVGRIDAQVKIRGHRIELGEVESQLAQHPAVAQCAVVARGQAGEQVLIAYWSAHADAAADVLQLHDHMRHRLPSHMLPQDYLQMDALPRTANGKIDRGALPDPDQLRATSVHVAPEPGIETRLAALWEALLGGEGIGRNDNFFKRGGHSLLISRIRDAFDVEARIKLIFDHPELSAMAVQLQALIEETADAGPALDVLEL